MLETNIKKLINLDIYNKQVDKEKKERKEIEKFAEQYKSDNNE